MADQKAPSELTAEEVEQSQGGLFGIGGWNVVKGVAGVAGCTVGGPVGGLSSVQALATSSARKKTAEAAQGQSLCTATITATTRPTEFSELPGRLPVGRRLHPV